MTEPESNPYESPRTRTPPIMRLTPVWRFVCYLVVMAVGFAAFVVCCGTVCLAGNAVMFSGTRPAAGLRGVAGFLIMAAGIPLSIAAALILANRLLRWMLGKESEDETPL